MLIIISLNLFQVRERWIHHKNYFPWALGLACWMLCMARMFFEPRFESHSADIFISFLCSCSFRTEARVTRGCGALKSAAAKGGTV